MWWLAWHVVAARYVLVTSPPLGQVLYWRVPSAQGETDELGQQKVQGSPSALISGLKAPVGLALDHARHGLYVADPATLKITLYIVTDAGSAGLEVSKGVDVVSNYVARWVACDSVGNVFFTDEGSNVIYKVSAGQLVNPPEFAFLGEQQQFGSYKNQLTQPTKLYDGKEVASVSGPGGIAVDNFRVFWANKIMGTEAGSVVQGFETVPMAAPTATASIALNAIKVYGVCLTSSNVYFTDDKTFLYGVKSMGGAIATISEKMHGPRGCAWDGDGTVFVADEAGGKVYSFPGNMKSLSPQVLEKAFDVEGPAGVAVFSTSSALALLTGLLFWAL